MPRTSKRHRMVFCDCKDCEDIQLGPGSYEWEAAAKQLPPPRSLILLLEGFNHSCNADASGACCSLDTVALPHFDNVARGGVTFCAATRSGALVPHAALLKCKRLRLHSGELLSHCLQTAQLCRGRPLDAHSSAIVPPSPAVVPRAPYR